MIRQLRSSNGRFTATCGLCRNLCWQPDCGLSRGEKAGHHEPCEQRADSTAPGAPHEELLQNAGGRMKTVKVTTWLDPEEVERFLGFFSDLQDALWRYYGD